MKKTAKFFAVATVALSLLCGAPAMADNQDDREPEEEHPGTQDPGVPTLIEPSPGGARQ